MGPPSAPIKKKKFTWSDADENEIRDYCKLKYDSCTIFLDLRDKRSGQDDNQPALVFGGQNSNLEGFNPALLSAL
jgi:hypothetical protein